MSPRRARSLHKQPRANTPTSRGFAAPPAGPHALRPPRDRCSSPEVKGGNKSHLCTYFGGVMCLLARQDLMTVSATLTT